MIFTVTQSSQYRRKVCSSARGLVCFTEIEAGIDNSARLSLRASVQEARISGDVCATRHLKDAARHGLWRDKRPEEYEHSIERAWRSHHRLAVRRGTLIGQLAVNERHAATALEQDPAGGGARSVAAAARGRDNARPACSYPRGHARPPIRARTNARARPLLNPLVGGPGPATGVAVIPFRA